MKQPVFGIIGSGSISRFHFAGLRRLGARIAHIADLNEAAARPLCEEFGAKYSADYRALLDDPEVTVVSVLTSGATHLPMCLAAIEAGKDVICEKTLANSPEEAEQIARAAKAKGVLFFTAYMKRYFPAAIKARELLPKLGRIFTAHARVYQCWGDLFENADATRHAGAIKLYGGAILKCGGSHMLDLVLYFLGRPSSLSAHMDFIPESDIDRKVDALLAYENGATVLFEAVAHPLKKIGHEHNSWEEYVEINGVNGRLTFETVMWDHPDRNAAQLRWYDNETGTETSFRFDIANPFDVEMEYLYNCLSHRMQGENATTVTGGFDVDYLIDAIQRSHASGSRVALDYRGL